MTLRARVWIAIVLGLILFWVGVALVGWNVLR